jgi:hypothetical protein
MILFYLLIFMLLTTAAKFVYLALGCAALATGGCAPYQNYQAETLQDAGKPILSLEQAQACCSAYSELAYKKLPEQFRATLSIDENDPVFLFDSGKSYVEPILLPQTGTGTLLEIQSVVSHRNLASASTVLFPVVTLLDQDHNTIATLDDLPFIYDNPFGGWRSLTVVVTLDSRFDNARYALIHTTDEKLKQALSTQKPVRIIKQSGFDTILYAQPTLSRKRIQFSATGVVNITAFPLDNG